MTVGREPNAMQSAHLTGTDKVMQQHRRGTGQVGYPELFYQRRGGGLKAAQQPLHVLAQGRNGECLRCSGGGQQVTVAEQHPLRIIHQKILAAVVDKGKQPCAIECSGHRLADTSQHIGRRSLDPKHDQAGGRPRKQFFRYQTSGAGVATRQKFRHIAPNGHLAERQSRYQRGYRRRKQDRPSAFVIPGAQDTRLIVMRLSSPFACTV